MAFGLNRRELVLIFAALIYCAAVVLLDAGTSGDIIESFLFPLVFLIIAPIRRDGAFLSFTVLCVGLTIWAGYKEAAAESGVAMLVNRGIAIAVTIGVGWLLIRLARTQRQVMALATTDPLTGLLNRRHFMDLAGREVRRAERLQSAMVVLMVDIDHFKRINDTYGHPVGDEVIKAVAKVCLNSVRPTDVAARFGGEEFVVLLPQSEREGALIAAERIRTSAAALEFDTGQKGAKARVTVSIGLAELEPDGALPDAISRADRALYQAKANGRNRICVDGVDVSTTVAA